MWDQLNISCSVDGSLVDGSIKLIEDVVSVEANSAEKLIDCGSCVHDIKQSRLTETEGGVAEEVKGVDNVLEILVGGSRSLRDLQRFANGFHILNALT